MYIQANFSFCCCWKGSAHMCVCGEECMHWGEGGGKLNLLVSK